MMYIVDGTGEFFDDDYAVEMAGSHCKVLEHLNKGNAFYERGPCAASVIKSVTGAVDKVMHKLLQYEFPPALLAPGQKQAPRSQIFLVGFSRGGAAVLRVAHLLDRQDIPVEAMFLFDAVNMTALWDMDMVPGNVRHCWHAIRNEGAERVMEQEAATLWKKCQAAKGFDALHAQFGSQGSGSYTQFIVRRAALMNKQWPDLDKAVKAWWQKARTLEQMQVAMRNSWGVAQTAGNATKPSEIKLSLPFGNCATRFDPKCKGLTKEFACSHGAIGGTPWTTLGDEIATIDREGSRSVWAWMSGHMREFKQINAGKAVG